MMRRFSCRLPVLFLIVAGLSAPVVWGQEASLEVTVVPEAAQVGETVEIRVTFTIPDGLHQTRQEEYFFLEVEPVPGLVVGETVYPDGPVVDGAVSYYEQVTLIRTIRIAADAEAGARTLRLRVGYQLCNDEGQCFFPQEEQHEVLLSVGATADDAGKDGLTAWGVIRFLLMALLGGALLNVMPCVLPVLSIKALSLVKQGGQDRRKILLSAYAYSAGILFSFLALSVVVVVLKLSGELVGWGFQFQNPAFVIVLLAVVFGFALSLFDVYVVMPMGTGLAVKASGRSGYLGSFLTGIMAVLLATPCTAPFLGAALGFAFSQPPAIIVAILMMVGVGLALPFLLLGFWPGIVQKIPKPGPWMDVFKTLMGFLLLGTAVYLLDVLFFQIGGRNLIRVLIFLLVIAFGAWVYGHFGKPGRTRWNQWVSLAVAVALIASGAVVLLRFDKTATAKGSRPAESVAGRPGWETFSPELVDTYRQQGRAMLVDFGARWCWTCKVNESAVLDAAEVAGAFEDRGVIRVYGDYTNNDETIGQWIRRFGRAGVPVYLFYPLDGAEPIVLPELLTKKMILDLLDEHVPARARSGTATPGSSPFAAPFK